MGYSGAGGKLIHEKNQKQKISWHCPFKWYKFIAGVNDTAKKLFIGVNDTAKKTVHRCRWRRR